MGDTHTGYALRFISGKYQGNEYPLKANQEIIVGRGSEFDIVLVEDMVSRRHAKFVTGEDYAILQDLGSTNGSFVNGERIRKIRLKEGDRILIGTSILKLVPFKGEIGDDPLEPPQAHKAPLALPPGPSGPQITMDAPSFNASKALPPAGGSGNRIDLDLNGPPPSLDFLSPSGSAPIGGGNVGGGMDLGGGMASVSTFSVTEDPVMPAPDLGQSSMSGELNETPLSDLIDLFANSRRNAVLTVSGPQEGRLHFHNGRIVGAIVGNNPNVAPLKAAQRILGWTRGTYNLYPPKDDAIPERIDQDANQLLSQAKRQADEITRYKRELPPQSQRISVPIPLQPSLRDLRPEFLETFQLVLNTSSLYQVLDQSRYTDVDTYQHLAFLYKNQYIQAG